MSEEFRSPHQPDAWSSVPAPPQTTGGNAELDNLEEDLLVQTAELVEQVQKQLADLNRREQALNAQTGQLEQDSRAFRLEKQAHEQQVLDKQDRLRSIQQEHDARRADFDDEQATMAEHAATVERDRTELNEQRERLRQEVQAELEEQRAVLLESISKSEAERQEFSQSQQRLVDQETELPRNS